jgi:hypothetical protein
MSTSTTYYESAQFLSITPGVYMLSWYNTITNNGANSTITKTFMAVGTAAANRDITNQQIGIGNITLGAARVFGGSITLPITVVTGTTSLFLSVMMEFSGGTLVNTGTTDAACRLMRIA